MAYKEWTTGRVVKYVGGGLAGVAALVVGLNSFTCVSKGHVGVQDMMGDIQEEELEPGVNFINPFMSVTEMNTRTQQLKETLANVPTNEGLQPKLEVSVLYHIIPEKASNILDDLGESYDDVIIVPSLRGTAREVIGGFPASALYSDQGRTKIAADIENKLRPEFLARGIVLEDVILRDVALPQLLVQSIELKMQEQQAAEQMEYTLAKAGSEAEQKRIVAEGEANAARERANGEAQALNLRAAAEASAIRVTAEAQAAANRSIAETINDDILRWRYIEAFEALAASDGKTFFVTPYDAQGMLPMMTMPMDQTR